MSSKSKISSCILFFLLTIFISFQLYCQVPGIEIINQKDLLQTVKFLSSKEMQGRLPGTEGYDKAAQFMSDEFSKLKLKPIGNKGYFQQFDVESNEINTAKLSLVEGKKVIKEYQLGNDFVCRTFTGSGNFIAPVAFCGYGLTNPDDNYDDFANIDVKGKILIVFKPAPAWKISDKGWGSIYPRVKAAYAMKHGALALMIVSLPNDKEPQKTIGSASEGGNPHIDNFPIVHISLDVAADFFKNSGWTLKQLQSKIDSTKKRFSLNLKTTASINVKAKYTKTAKTENIIGMLEGSDTKFKDEYLVITAHLDHVGNQTKQLFYPGANDNASGSAAVLQLARAFVNSGVKPKRSVVFILLACEEHNLDGSRFAAANFPYGTDKITAAFNLDCIGHGDSIQLGNGKSCPVLWKIAKTKDSLYTRRVVKSTWSGGGADLTAFFDKGVPGLYFVTTKSYTHLHYMTDKVETLNPPLFEKVVRLAYITANDITNAIYTKETLIKDSK